MIVVSTQQRSGAGPSSITFTHSDAHGVHHPYTDALVIQALIDNSTICRILIDEGSAVDILYKEAFTKMGLGTKDLRTNLEPLYGFSGESMVPTGIINFPITVGTAPLHSTVQSAWTVVDSPSPYNAIIERPTLVALRAATSVYNLCMKFPTRNGTGVVKGGQFEARTCYSNSLRIGQNRPCPRQNREAVSPGRTTMVVDLDPRLPTTVQQGAPADDLCEVQIDYADPSRVVKVGAALAPEEKGAIIRCIKGTREVFAWSHEDMVGIDPTVMCHRLNVDPAAAPKC